MALLFRIFSLMFPKNFFMFFLEGFMSSFPFPYFLMLLPRKSNPSLMCVMSVLLWDNSRPLSPKNSSIIGLASFSRSSFVAPVTIKSSAYLMKFTLLFALNLADSILSIPSKVKFDMTGEMGEPYVELDVMPRYILSA